MRGCNITKFERLPTPIAAILAVLLIAAAPPPAPTTQQQPPRIDLSSPKTADKSLYYAVQAQDAAAMREILYAPTPADQKLADAMIDLILAGRKLADAAHDKFGPEGDHLGQMMMNPEELANIDAGEVKEDGPDDATLTAAGQSRGIKFHRDNGKWRLVVADFLHAGEKDIPSQLTLLNSMTRIMRDTTGEIAAGKYETPHDAEAAIVGKCNQVMIEEAQQANTAADKRMRELDKERAATQHKSQETPSGTSPATQPATSATAPAAP